jgi:hypothetical protein
MCIGMHLVVDLGSSSLIFEHQEVFGCEFALIPCFLLVIIEKLKKGALKFDGAISD